MAHQNGGMLRSAHRVAHRAVQSLLHYEAPLAQKADLSDDRVWDDGLLLLAHLDVEAERRENWSQVRAEKVVSLTRLVGVTQSRYDRGRRVQPGLLSLQARFSVG